MKRMARFSLVDQIGRELQSRMTFTDIDIFLKGFGVDVTKKTSGANSKWIYSKELLADAPDDAVLKIADELEIAHGHTLTANIAVEDSRFWIPSYFRLFISHISLHKVRAGALKDALRGYAVSGFVAHEDIEPTLEWQVEIEKALHSMDALVAILTPEFHDSKWTDQEVGYALGRGVLVIPLRTGLDAYGFIGKSQGIQAEGKSVAQVSSLVFQAISRNALTKNKIATVLADQVVGANDPESATRFLANLQKIDALPQGYLERVRDNLADNLNVTTNEEFVAKLNAALKECELAPFVPKEGKPSSDDDEIPF